LLLVGAEETDLDPLKSETRNLINAHKKIFATGYQLDVRPFFAISDILVFPSYREGFPNVVLQAGAMNLPSIVSNINGCNEIISDGYNGLIVPPKDKNKLEDSILQLSNNLNLRIGMSKVSRLNIEKKYSRLKMWETILNEYKDLEVL